MRCISLISLFAGVSIPSIAMAEVASKPLVAAEQPQSVSEKAPDDDDQDTDVPESGNEIVVVATRIPGQLVVPEKPIRVFDESDIAAYGANSIEDLIAAIAPQTGSGRGRGDGRPVILVNGQRIASFRELFRIPPEAIRRMEVLPEEVALRFGYSANQRVLNMILKPSFNAVTLAGEYNLPTRGGYDNYELESGLFKIAGPRRYNISAKYTDTSMLTEAERNVLQEPGTEPTVDSDPDPADFRSLASAQSELELNATMTQGIGEGGLGGSVTANAAYSHTRTKSWSGLDNVTLEYDGDSAVRTLPGPIAREILDDTFEAGLGFNRQLGSWMFSITGDGSYADTETTTDRRRSTQALVDAAAAGELDINGPLPDVPSAGVNVARNRALDLTSLATISGSPFSLPAGDANLTVKAGYDYSNSKSTNTAAEQAGDVKLNRGDASVGANLALPLTRGGDEGLGAIGDVSLNFSAGLDHLSDFGTLTNWTGGATWSPTGKLTFQASYIVEQAAPSLSQLGSPVLLNYNVPIYDYTNGTTVLVTTTSGGNPDLRKETQRDIKMAATWELPFLKRSNLIVEYFRNRSTNVTEEFPALTPAIEAAFPDRVVRDTAGNLIGIDERAVTYDEERSSRIRWGLNLSGELGKAPEQSGAGGPGGARPAGAGQGGQTRAPGGGAPPFMGPRGPQGGRWNLSFFHTWRFTDTVLIADGVPELNQLDGDALNAGGVPRHAIEAEGGLFKNGYGLRLEAEWEAPATVNGGAASESSDLRFGSTFIVDLRVFADLGRNESLVAKMPFLKGVRVSLTADNLLDSRQKVTDENGNTPIAYQRAYREPQGRVVGIDIRKIF